jgi:thioredoxin 1
MKKTFAQLIQDDKPVLVDFYATWCGPCQALAPTLETLAKEYGDALRVIKIDVDKNPAAAAQYQVRGVPALLLFKQGRLLWRQAGALPLPALRQAVDAALKG